VAAEVIMPRLSDSMEEGTILRWLKSVGDEVKKGDELVEIETDKANMVYESTDEGTLVEILAQEGDTLPIGEVIARIGDEKELSAGKPADRSAEGRDGRPAQPKPKEEPKAKEEPEPQRAQPADSAPRAAPATTTTDRPAAPAADGRIKASPVARRMAGELGVELARIEGTGPGGRIVKADVEAAAGGARAAPAPSPATPSTAPAPPARAPAAPAPAAVAEAPETAKGQVQVVDLNRLQRTVARRMAESKATVPHFYLQMEIDMSEAVRMREQLKQVVEEGRPAPTYNDMVVKACGLALREFPRANGSYKDGRVELYSRVNIGIAVAAQDTLVVPTIFDADRKSLGEIAVESRALAGKVRDGTVTPPELSGGTFTVSNLGMYGIDNFSAVINPPQAALLAVGAVAAKPAVDPDSGAIVARRLMGVTLACDHRILYGADGAQFVARVRDLLERPLSLSL
jgi:pyruvate dehydrogenase E2 component (dihydrolipoyllysine-residue acetyltransferase)